MLVHCAGSSSNRAHCRPANGSVSRRSLHPRRHDEAPGVRSLQTSFVRSRQWATPAVETPRDRLCHSRDIVDLCPDGISNPRTTGRGRFAYMCDSEGGGTTGNSRRRPTTGCLLGSHMTPAGREPVVRPVSWRLPQDGFFVPVRNATCQCGLARVRPSSHGRPIVPRIAVVRDMIRAFLRVSELARAVLHGRNRTSPTFVGGAERDPRRGARGKHDP